MTVAVGDKITAELGNSWRVKYLKKAASESVTSSTTLQNDNDFAFTIPANKVYLVDIELAVSAGATGDIKTQWAVTGGVAALTTRTCRGLAASATDSADGTMRFSRTSLTSDATYGGSSATSINERFIIETTTAGTSGTLTLQWAQNVSNATATTVTANSFAILTELEAWT